MKGCLGFLMYFVVSCMFVISYSCQLSYHSSRADKCQGKTQALLLSTSLVPMAVLSDFMVKAAFTFVNIVNCCKRQNWASALVRFRQCAHYASLHGIFLSNVPSFTLCFKEMWLGGSDLTVLQLEGFQLFRVDRNTELCGRTKARGIR